MFLCLNANFVLRSQNNYCQCFITFCVSRRRRKMYCGQARLCVCLCVCLSVRMPTLLQGPGCNLGSGRGCPLVVHYWADLQSMHGFRCYGNNTRNAWQSPVVIRQAHRTHYACTHAPAIESTRLLRARCYLQRGRSIPSISRGCGNANTKC